MGPQHLHASGEHGSLRFLPFGRGDLGSPEEAGQVVWSQQTPGSSKRLWLSLQGVTGVNLWSSHMHIYMHSTHSVATYIRACMCERTHTHNTHNTQVHIVYLHACARTHACTHIHSVTHMRKHAQWYSYAAESLKTPQCFPN